MGCQLAVSAAVLERRCHEPDFVLLLSHQLRWTGVELRQHRLVAEAQVPAVAAAGVGWWPLAVRCVPLPPAAQPAVAPPQLAAAPAQLQPLEPEGCLNEVPSCASSFLRRLHGGRSEQDCCSTAAAVMSGLNGTIGFRAIRNPINGPTEICYRAWILSCSQ
jgi:hypothetical protein